MSHLTWEKTANEWEPPRHTTWRRYSDQLNIRLLDRLLPTTPIARVLKTDAFDEATSDVGLARRLQESAEQIVLLDVSPRMLRAAGQRQRDVRIAGVASDVRRLPFDDASFDLVFSNSTLDHLDSIDEIAVAITELRRVLRPGGKLLLTLDNGQNPIIALRSRLPTTWLRRLGLVPYPVGANCGRRKLVELLHGAGLEPGSVGSLVHCPRVAAVAAASLIDRSESERAKQMFLRFMPVFETLERLPTRYFTGHFVAVVAERPSGS